MWFSQNGRSEIYRVQRILNELPPDLYKYECSLPERYFLGPIFQRADVIGLCLMPRILLHFWYNSIRLHSRQKVYQIRTSHWRTWLQTFLVAHSSPWHLLRHPFTKDIRPVCSSVKLCIHSMSSKRLASKSIWHQKRESTTSIGWVNSPLFWTVVTFQSGMICTQNSERS